MHMYSYIEKYSVAQQNELFPNNFLSSVCSVVFRDTYSNSLEKKKKQEENTT